jgi:uncharacterized UPF0160 family protein
MKNEVERIKYVFDNKSFTSYQAFKGIMTEYSGDYEYDKDVPVIQALCKDLIFHNTDSKAVQKAYNPNNQIAWMAFDRLGWGEEEFTEPQKVREALGYVIRKKYCTFFDGTEKISNYNSTDHISSSLIVQDFLKEVQSRIDELHGNKNANVDTAVHPDAKKILEFRSFKTLELVDLGKKLHNYIAFVTFLADNTSILEGVVKAQNKNAMMSET